MQQFGPINRHETHLKELEDKTERGEKGDYSIKLRKRKLTSESG